MPSYELLAAYCRTDYRVDLPDRHFSICLGRPNPEVDELLQSAAAACWALITAENPRSQQLSDGANALRRELLSERLEQAGWRQFPARALCPMSNWPPEHGHLVIGLTEQQALELAAEFD